MAKIIAFDPGVTTGFVVWEKDHFAYGGHISHDDLGKIESVLTRHFRITSSNDCAIIERVRAASQTFDQRAIEIMGVIKYLCIKQGLPIILQSPGVMSGPVHWVGPRLSMISSPHIRDAACHTLAYLVPTKVELDKISYEFDCNT